MSHQSRKRLFSDIINRNMAGRRNCEAGATLAPITEGSELMHDNKSLGKYATLTR